MLIRKHRIRKVKCDEGWPACSKCISTGRVCDGYGIWGGGGNTYQDRVDRDRPAVATQSRPTLRCMPVALSSRYTEPQEQGYLEWFFRRSVVKLPGIFSSPLWESVIPQASSTEPAVLHAILALSAAHKNEVFRQPGPVLMQNKLGKHGQFALHQYSIAIRTLKPHFLAQTRESSRITLITCLIFIYLEFLLGNSDAGFLHINKGFKILEHFQFNVWLSNDLTDQSIKEGFSRINLQSQLLGRMGHMGTFLVSKFELPTGKFETWTQSRKYLDLILSDTLNITQCQIYSNEPGQIPSLNELYQRQTYIRGQLVAWRSLLSESKTHLQVHTDIVASFAYRLLSIYHTMAKIMIETCLATTNESVLDKHIEDFTSLVVQSVDLLNALRSASKRSATLPGEENSIFGSVADIAWIPPLYYTAIKCRNHRLRVHAAKLLRLNSHKEGLWDSYLVGRIAQEVIRFEEGDFYAGTFIDDNFPIDVSPSADDLILPSLPRHYLVNRVEIFMPKYFENRAQIACWRLKDDGEWVRILREFNVVDDHSIPTKESR